MAAAQPTHQNVAGPYPCLFLAALLCGEGTWLFSALPCGGSGLGRGRPGRPRAPPVWGTASTSVLVEISHSAFTAIAAAASSPEVPPWVLPLSGERGVPPSYHGAPYGGRCHVALFPSSLYDDHWCDWDVNVFFVVTVLSCLVFRPSPVALVLGGLAPLNAFCGARGGPRPKP